MASKRNQTPVTTPILVGADIGYGFTKIVSTGIEPVVFPSVWGYSRELKFQAGETASKYPGDQITDDDGDWFIGNLAQSQIPAGQQMKLRGRTADEKELGNVARLRLLKAGLGKMFPNQRNGDVLHFQIATGLPVDHMHGAQDMKASFIGQHIIQTDNTHFIANIMDVRVMPQPYGTIYRNMLTVKGEINPCHTYTRTGVIDIGTFTVDLALDDDGEYIDDLSGSVESGVFVIQEAVRKAYERDFNQKPTLREIETIIQCRCVRAFGEPVDYSIEVENGRAILRDATLSLLAEKWSAAASLDVIYVAGGGASLIINDIKRAYRQARLVDDAQISNARGYLNYALFAATGD
jgi:hypothetical protein